MATRFRKRPIVVEAMHFDGTIKSATRICCWANDSRSLDDDPCCSFISHDGDNTFAHDFQVDTLEGPLEVAPGDWIIKGVKGEFYPCKPDIFKATYEPCD